MKREKILLILGIWIAILPYIGLPYSWKDTLISLSGLALVYLSYIVYKSAKKSAKKTKAFDNFKENVDFVEPPYEVETEVVEETAVFTGTPKGRGDRAKLDSFN